MTRWNDLFFNKTHTDMVRRCMILGNLSIDELVNFVLNEEIGGEKLFNFT